MISVRLRSETLQSATYVVVLAMVLVMVLVHYNTHQSSSNNNIIATSHTVLALVLAQVSVPMLDTRC